MTKDLPMINAVAAQILARQVMQLAHATKVRWISLAGSMEAELALLVPENCPNDELSTCYCNKSGVIIQSSTPDHSKRIIAVGQAWAG